MITLSFGCKLMLFWVVSQAIRMCPLLFLLHISPGAIEILSVHVCVQGCIYHLKFGGKTFDLE